MSSTRVMATCSLLGQAMGTAASICAKYGIKPCELRDNYISELQQTLMTDGVFLPGCRRNISPLSREAKLNLTDADRDILFNGIDRPRSDEEKNGIELNVGDKIEFTFEDERDIHGIRVMFDLDYTRESVSPNKKMRWFPQKLHTGLDFEPMKVANTIVKSFRVLVDGKCVYETDKNYNSLVKLTLSAKGKCVTLELLETWGSDKVSVYACEVM